MLILLIVYLCSLMSDKFFFCFQFCVTFSMVMAQIFGHLDYLDGPAPHLPEMSMDLGDFEFDLDTIHESLGSWIQPDLLSSVPSFVDLEDLDITKAVRYDCMWSASVQTQNTSANSSRCSSSTSGGGGGGNNTNLLSHSFCENALLDEFLLMLDSGSFFNNSATTTSDVKTEVKEEEELRSRAVKFTSLDHCYVSTTCPPAHSKHEDSIDTPPESSDDDLSRSAPSTASLSLPSLSHHHCRHSSSSSRPSSQTLPHHHHHNINNNNNNNLVGGKAGSGGVAKFSFCVKLKADNSSRSVLKQHLWAVRLPLNVSAVGFRTVGGSSDKLGSGSILQAGVLRRNQMERQRRNELKVAFDELKATITDIADSDRVSKQMILDKAVENCRGLQSREAALRLRREWLKRSNSQLKERLRLLQQQ